MISKMSRISPRSKHRSAMESCPLSPSSPQFAPQTESSMTRSPLSPRQLSPTTRASLRVSQATILLMVSGLMCVLGALQLMVHDAISAEIRQVRGLANSIDLQEENAVVKHYTSIEERDGREQRFPSIEERLKVYLSTWYVPPCEGTMDGRVQYNLIQNLQEANASSQLLIQELSNTKRMRPSTFVLDNLPIHGPNAFRMDREVISNCNNKFCKDTEAYIFPALDRIAEQSGEDYIETPLVMQFGDAEVWKVNNTATFSNDAYPVVPSVKKFRHSMEKSDIERVTSQTCYNGNPETAGTRRDPQSRTHGIISIVSNYDRHFGTLEHVPPLDIPWEQKLDAAVWRGAMTGRRPRKQVDLTNLTESEKCHHVQRCHFVLRHGRSSLVDARLVSIPNKPLPVSSTIDGVEMFGDQKDMAEILRYKCIVMLEGNDVSSGLKWALFSNSVVLTPKPTCTSWAMEELLEEWVHYVPIADDFSDVDKKVQWVIDNSAQAKEIAKRGRLWLTDLVFHPASKAENEYITDETIRRYQKHFVRNPSLA